ncbi:MAG: type II secretion system protein [Minisyncoccia bacterium]
MSFKNKKGYSLVELLVYMAIFAVSAIFLTAILLSITRIQTRQNSVNEVNQQISFVANTIQQLVQQSSLVDMANGVATSTLTLRMASSTLDPVVIYASGTMVYLSEGTVIPSSTPAALTNSSVNVGNFSVTKYENNGGIAVVQLGLTATYNSPTPAAAVTRSLQTAIARVSAAQFDSSVYPTTDGALDLGLANNKWRYGYFSSNVTINGKLGLTSDPATIGNANTLLKAAGNIGFSASTYGPILVSPGGTCYLLGISNAGIITTSTATCP